MMKKHLYKNIVYIVCFDITVKGCVILYMNHLYIGNKKIKKAVIKTKVNSDFITAGPNDIKVGKTSIDANYNTIEGSMVEEHVLVDLTLNATADPSDVTVGKTGWRNGVEIIGTAVRKTPKDFISGVIESYKVANNNVINAGDFVKFVEEVCGCGYEITTKMSEEATLYNNPIANSHITMHLYDMNKILVIFTIYNNNYIPYYTILTVDNGNITFTNPRQFSIQLSYAKILVLENNKPVLITGSRAYLININNDTVTLSDPFSITYNNSSFKDIIVLNSNELFVAYTVNDSEGDPELQFSRVKLENDVLTATLNINKDRTIYVNELTMCRLDSNRVFLAYAASFNSYSQYLVLDVSDPNNVYFGVWENLHVMNTSSMDCKLIEDNFVILTCRIYDSGSSYSLPYMHCFKVENLSISDHYGRGFGNTSFSVSNNEICVLTTNLIVIRAQVTSRCYLIPLYRNQGDIEFQFGTMVDMGFTNQYTRIVKIEDNKFLMTYFKDDGNNNIIGSKILQINNKDDISDILTVYDMERPLTATMVALALGSDEICGLSDEDGVGRLYGGDTIRIIRPIV